MVSGADIIKRARYVIQLGGLSLAVFSATGACAEDVAAAGQVPGAPADAAPPGEITVTAQRRSERLQDVPVSVSVISAEKLSETGITDITMIKAVVPGANVRDIAGYSQPYIRGVGSSAKNPLNEPPVATYVDEVYYGNQVNLLTFNNLRSIEVIKGPQGTLFGRNATGGLFNITTVDPSFTPTGTIHLGYGNYQSFGGDGYFATGITDKLAADLSVVGDGQGEGFGKNLTTGKDTYRDYHNYAARSKVLFNPDADTKIVLIADYSDQKTSVGAASTPKPGSGSFPNGFYPVISNNPYDVQNDIDGLIKSRSGGVSLNMSHDIGSAVRLKSITAYRGTTYDLAGDQDSTPVPIAGIYEHTHYDQITQELQAQSVGSGPFSWTTGVFYFDSRAKDHLALKTPAYALAYAQIYYAEAIAGYAQGTYTFLPNTNLTAGVRYTHETRKVAGDLEQQLVSGPVKIFVPQTTRTLSVDKPSFRATLDHKFTPDVLVYASFNSSFKSGGFSNISAVSFLPETLKAYEVGAKSEFLDRRLTLNLSGFYYDYRNIQVQLLVPGGTTVVTNGAGAHVYGGDADMRATLSSRLSLTGSVELLHAKYTAFDSAPIGTPLGGRGVVIGSAAGNNLPFAPHVTANLGLNYKIPLGHGTLTTSIVSYLSGRYYAQPDNAVYQTTYGTANGSITWVSASGFSARIWANNITNKVVMNNAVDPAPTGNQIIIYDSPRTFGFTLGYHF